MVNSDLPLSHETSNRNEREDEDEKMVRKLRVFENGAQDNCGAWICREFPSLHVILEVTDENDIVSLTDYRSVVMEVAGTGQPSPDRSTPAIRDALG